MTTGKIWRFLGAGLAVLIGTSVAGAVARYSRSEAATNQYIVSDSTTGLVWQGCAAELSGSLCGSGSALTYTWQNALKYCEALNWGNQTDWRLPSVIELSSIVDSKRTDPSIDTDSFPGTLSNWFWTSSSYAGGSSYAWYVTFYGGYVYYAGKASGYYVRCVRGGP